MQRFLTEFFTFSKREIRSLLLVLILCMLVIIAGMISPVLINNRLEGPDPKLVAESIEFSTSLEKKSIIIRKEKPETNLTGKVKLNLSCFDPNHASREDLQEFGLPVRIINNILKYREAGGTFREKTDLRKIYGMDEDFFEKLEPFILFEETPVDHESDSIKSEAYSLDHREIPLDLNTCSYIDLFRLLNGDTILTSRILNYRELMGGYATVEQLEEVYGMGDSLYFLLQSKVFTDTVYLRKLSIGNSEYRDFLRHPYLEKSDVELIMTYRKFCESDPELEEFVRMKILPDSVICRILPYLEK